MTRIYKGGVDPVGVRGRPPVKWEDRLLEYVRERGNRRLRGIEGARIECMDRSKWRFSAMATSLREFPGTGLIVD